MLYRCQVNHDGLQAGQVYELDADDEAYREGAIEAGFLTPERADLGSYAADADGEGRARPLVEPAPEPDAADAE